MYEHFRESERPFVDYVRTLYKQVAQYHQEKMTDFLDRREQEIMKIVIGKDETVDLAFFGGADGCERQRASLRPAYLKEEEVQWPIIVLAASFSSKFVTLTHRDVLGALMNIGLDRSKFGDILMTDCACMFACTKEVEPYVCSTLTRIAQTKVQFSTVPRTAFVIPLIEWQERQVTVSSLRLDTVIAVAYRLSRGKAVAAIEKGLVKVNDQLIEKANVGLYVGDELSVRGLGRAKLLQEYGVTKKERIRIVVGRLLS